jgi:hypothetical protein
MEEITMVRIAPGGHTVAILVGTAKLVFVRPSGVVKTVPVAHNAGVTHLEWSPKGEWIYAASKSSTFIYGYRCEAPAEAKQTKESAQPRSRKR